MKKPKNMEKLIEDRLEILEFNLLQAIWTLEDALIEMRKGLQDFQIELLKTDSGDPKHFQTK